MPPKKKKGTKSPAKPATKRAGRQPITKAAKAIPAIKKTCVCDEGDDGFFYCFKKVQGKWISCRGPFNTLQECISHTGEQCG